MSIDISKVVLGNFTVAVCDFLWYDSRPVGLGSVYCMETKEVFKPIVSSGEESVSAYGLTYIKRSNGNIHVVGHNEVYLVIKKPRREKKMALRFMSPTARRLLA